MIRVSIAATVALLCMAQASVAADEAAVRAAVEKLDPAVKVEGTRSSAVNNLYRVKLDGASGYVTADGQYFIIGDMYEVKSRRNLSEDIRKEERLQAMQAIDSASTIVFAPASPRHTITVFTDVDCPYCRKLHSEIAEYNQHGIAVRYLAFPRSGPGSESWKKMEAIWCSKDRRDAFTRTKLGEKLDAAPADCNTKDIAQQYALGEQLGLQGTPMMVLEDGTVMSGYVPPAALAQQLDAIGAAAASTASTSKASSSAGTAH